MNEILGSAKGWETSTKDAVHALSARLQENESAFVDKDGHPISRHSIDGNALKIFRASIAFSVLSGVEKLPFYIVN